MSTKDSISAELAGLVEEAGAFVGLLEKGLQAAHADFTFQYQAWYTKATKLLAVLAPDRLGEFRSYYERDSKRKVFDAGTYAIQDYVMGIGPGNDRYSGQPTWDPLWVLALRVAAQRAILASLFSRIDGVLADIQAALAAEVEDTTLDAARRLVQINLRAAGALAGVVLEEHLQRVALARNVKVSKANPTIADLNDPLRQAGAYDLPTWRRIQLLADVRNLCTHKKGSDPGKDQVMDLINGVNWAVKSVV